MRIYGLLICAIFAFTALSIPQVKDTKQAKQIPAKVPLDTKIESFDVRDAILRDGLSELSLKHIKGLHLGFEEVIRDKIQDDPRAQSPHFSIHLEDKSVRNVLDELCKSDSRYMWSQDGSTINVYPRSATQDPAYLMNLWIDRLNIKEVPNPNQALTPLAKQFPTQQLGYANIGLGENAYEEPWTMVFESLTVRQFVNRIAEHMGSQTSWMWQGGKNERMFTFLKGGFHTSRATEQKPFSDASLNKQNAIPTH